MVLDFAFFAYCISELLEEVATIRYIRTTEYIRPLTVEEKIQKTFPEEPENMVAIAMCESNLNQEAVSPTRDFGVMQVNEKTWDSTANEMGLDYKSDVDDNLKLARHIYEVQSKSAWVCWHLVAYNN